MNRPKQTGKTQRMKRVKERIKKLRIRKFNDRRTLIAFVAVFAVLGLWTLISVRAAVPTVHFQAESGNLSGNAAVVQDGTASGGAYVQFGSSDGSDPGYVEGWGLPVWRDEFNGSTIDTSKWSVLNGQAWGRDWGIVTAGNAFVRDGNLVMRVSQRSSPTTVGGRTRWWNTAEIRSENRFEAQYGRWEMRARIGTVFPGSTGFWPAWWLRNSPNVGEIDIMEAWGSPVKRASPSYPNQGSAFGVWSDTSGGNVDKIPGGHYEQLLNLPRPYTTAEGFHTWVFEFTPDYAVASLDGQAPRRITRNGANGTIAAPWMWGSTFATNPWHMRLSTQMGDDYWSQNPTPDDNINAPLDFLVDYIRYWEMP